MTSTPDVPDLPLTTAAHPTPDPATESRLTELELWWAEERAGLHDNDPWESSWEAKGHRCHRCWQLNGTDFPGNHMRYYCPKCGEVRCGIPRHGETLVMPHYRKTESNKSTKCLGGAVDVKEDRAP